MKRFLWIPLLLFITLVPLYPAWSSESALAIGYGFALFNDGHSAGQIEEGSYNFLQASYFYEIPISRRWLIQVGPYLAYIMQPSKGFDAGVNLSLKAYPFTNDYSGLFFTVGSGGAYSTVDFSEQGGHAFFIIQGSIGYRYKNLFIEDRWRHYSNGNTNWPNRSINANIINVGMYF